MCRCIWAPAPQTAAAVDMELEHLRASSKAAQLQSKMLQERKRSAVVRTLQAIRMALTVALAALHQSLVQRTVLGASTGLAGVTQE